MKTLFVIAAVMVFSVYGSNLSAQQQVPFDTLNNIRIITPEIEEDLGYFKMYPNFRNAELFLNSDSTYTLKVNYMSDGSLKTKDLDLSESEYLELRKNVLSALKFKRDDEALNHRSSFLWGSAALGGSIWVPSLISLIDFDNGSTKAGFYLVALGGSYLIPGIATQDGNVSKGSANLAIGGGILGAGHGLLLYGLTSDAYNSDHYSSLVLTGSLAEYIAGYNYAKHVNLTGGEASMMTNNGILFGLHGLALSAVADFFEDDGSSKLGFGISLASSVVGVFLGKSMANDGRYTSGDAGIYSNLAALGAFTGGTINVLAENGSYKSILAIMVATTGVGQIIGHGISDDYDFTDSHANYALLGTIGGGLVGAGFGLMTEDYKGFMALSNLGAIAGFSAVFLSIDDEAESIDVSDNIDFEFNPSAFLTYDNIEFNPYYHKPAKVAGLKIRF